VIAQLLREAIGGMVFACDVEKGLGSTPLSDRMTARSVRFWSFRTLPGQWYAMNACIVVSRICSMRFPMRLENASTKCSTNSHMSSPRSRRGGTVVPRAFLVDAQRGMSFTYKRRAAFPVCHSGEPQVESQPPCSRQTRTQVSLEAGVGKGSLDRTQLVSCSAGGGQDGWGW
jgi:hypothetical protein